MLLTRTKSRVPYIRPSLVLARETSPLLRHVLVPTGEPGAVQVAELLDELNVPVNATVAEAQAAIKEATGHGRRKAVVLEAQRNRQARQ
jgi:hypothetical protein